MATNYLSLRSSAAASLSAINLTLSTLTGSTITALSNANTKSLVYSTLQGSSITASTMTGSTLYVSSLLQISSSGLLGIGTNPTQALHVQGSTIVSGAIGIGTNSPAASLDVNGSIISRAQVPGIAFLGDIDGAKWTTKLGGYNLSFGSDSGSFTGFETGTYLSRTYQYGVQFTSTGGMYIKGSVGIGTATVGAQLHIYGTISGEIARFLSGSGSANMWLGYQGSIRDAATILWRQIGTGSTANYLGIGAHSVDDILNVVAVGRVGIGTTTPTQTLDVNGTIARSGLKLPRVDYGTFTTGTTVSVPILFSDTQYSHLEIRIHYLVSAQCNITMSALDVNSTSLNFEEASLTTYQWNSQTAYSYNTTTGTQTSFNFANNVEAYSIDNILVMRIVRATGGTTTGFRSHYMYDNVYCIFNVGTARGYGMGHINLTSITGPALGTFRLTASTGNISGNYSITHYN